MGCCLGRPTLRTDQLGDTVTLVYDLAGRMTDREYRLRVNSPSGTIADQDDFTYDEAGRILTADKGRYGNTVTFTYDDGGRIETEALTIGMTTWTIGHEYDDAGRRSKTTYPSLNVVDFTYTNRGQLDTVVRGATTISDFTYDAGGRETSRTYGNGIVTNRTYVTGHNLIDDITTVNHANLSYGYSYDENHNVTAETIGGNMSGYGFTTGAGGYDDEDRLVGWQRNDTNLDLSWTLSDVGDWDSYTENTTTQNRTHGDAHELTAIDAASLSYDAKGNLTADEAGIAYSWDFDNMLEEVTVPASPARGIEGTHTYEYDALGRRVAKTVDDAVAQTSVTTVFVSAFKTIPPLGPSGGRVISEYEDGTLLREYVYGQQVDEPLSLIDRTALGASGTGTDELLYYHRNRVYSVTGITNSAGVVVEVYSYSAYGDVLIIDPATLNARPMSDYGNATLFTGRCLDREAGLYCFRTRYYMSSAGRFIATDHIGYTDGPHLFAAYFVPGSLDPSGLKRSIFWEEYWEWWQQRHPGLTPVQYDWVEDTLAKGCIGIVTVSLGWDRGGRPGGKCYSTLDLAKKARGDLLQSECPPCAPDRLMYYSVHLWNDGNPLPAGPADPNGNPTVDLGDWWNNGNPSGRPPGDWNGWIDADGDGEPDGGFNFDFGFWDPCNRCMLHGNHYHNPDRDGDGFGDYFPDSPITTAESAAFFCSSLDEWQDSYADFDTEVWCLVCRSPIYRASR